MSKQQLQTTTHRNATGTGAATSTGYVAPEKSTVIPIRPYKYGNEDDDEDDDDEEDDVDIDDIPLLSLASVPAAAAAAAPTTTSSSSASDRRNRQSNRKSKSKSKSTNADDTRNNVHQHPVAPAYTMIELNGILLPPIEFPPMDTCQSIFGTDQRVELGKFYMSGPDQKIPTLILGSHQVKGKVKRLKSPFCLMEKRYKNTTTTTTTAAFTTTTNESFSSSSEQAPPPNKKQKQQQPKKKQIECYQIIGIVSEKIIFDTYPKVIMRKMI